MTTESKRDLHADLAICEAATPGPWEWVGGEMIEERTGQLIPISCADSEFILESRQGWPEAIRRAITAEAEVERLREALRSIMHVSAWDGIAHELDRCYTLAKEALRK